MNTDHYSWGLRTPRSFTKEKVFLGLLIELAPARK